MQAIQYSGNLAAYVYNKYVQAYPVATLTALRELLPKLLIGLRSSRIVIDSIDKYNSQKQEFIIDDVLRLLLNNPHSHIYKVFVASRDIPSVSRKLRRRAEGALISLSEEHQSIRSAIDSFVQ